MSMSSSSSSLAALAPVPSRGISRSNSSSWLQTSSARFPRPQLPVHRGLGRSSAWVYVKDYPFEDLVYEMRREVLERRSASGDRDDDSFEGLLCDITTLAIGPGISFNKDLEPDDPLLTFCNRPSFSDECNNAFDELTSLEYSLSIVYDSFSFFFKKLALLGFVNFFRDSERRQLEDVEKLFTYQHKRSGEAKVRAHLMRHSKELYLTDQGVPLNALELIQNLERRTYEKLQKLLSVAQQRDETHLKDFIESEFLTQQFEVMKNLSEYVNQVRIFGEGGVRDLDLTLFGEYLNST